MQENTARSGDRVTILAAPKPQEFVRHRAAFYQAGQPLLAAGTRLQAPEIAVLAAAQSAQVKVFRRPKVAILSTGSELGTIDRPLQPGQIVDSNQYALAALVQQLGATPIRLGSVPDDRAALETAITHAIAQADIVLSTGGVSVGDYDYVDEILATLNAHIPIHSVAIKPGKPLTVATLSPPIHPSTHPPIHPLLRPPRQPRLRLGDLLALRPACAPETIGTTPTLATDLCEGQNSIGFAIGRQARVLSLGATAPEAGGIRIRFGGR